MNYKIIIISFLSIVYANCTIASQEELNKKLLKAVCQNNHAQVLILIKDGADINTHDNWTRTKSHSGYTPLHYAVHYNYIKLVQLLLDFGAQINNTDNKRRTPLHYAARDHKVHFVDLLLSHNALVNCQDWDGNTPLHVTFEKFFSTKAIVLSPLSTNPDHYRTIELLLSYGANVNAQTHNNGQTPLHYAVKADLLLPVELLLVHGADVTLQDKDGADALYCSSSFRIIQLLLDYGATDEHWQDPRHAASARFNNDLGFTFNPLSDVKKSRKKQTITYQDLLSKIHKPNRALKQEEFRKAIENGYYTLVKLFVRNGMQVTLEDLAFAKSQYTCHGNDFDHKSIGQFLFTYLQLFGLHDTPNRAAHLPHSVYTLLSRIYSRSTQDNSLIGPISKKGIIDDNYFTEDIVRTIARYI